MTDPPDRPSASDRPASDRPASDHPASDHPASDQPASDGPPAAVVDTPDSPPEAGVQVPAHIAMLTFPGSRSIYGRVLYVLFLVAVPALLILPLTPQPEWQSDAWADYAALMLAQTVDGFAPLWVATGLALAACLLWQGGRARSALVRWMIYLGSVLHVQIAVCWLLVHLDMIFGLWPITFTGLFVGGIIASSLGGVWSRGRWSQWRIGPLGLRQVANLVTAGLILAAVLILAGAVDQANELVLLIGIGSVVATLFWLPVWAALGWSHLSWQLLTFGGGLRRYSLAKLLLAVSLAAGYMALWRIAMARALAEYALLPVDPPADCYVSTAAARGHRALVRSAAYRLPRGETLWINQQMLWLKAAEVVLRAALPGVHRKCRAVYNGLGPPLARRLNSPWRADAAYLMLKPVEWAARLLLRLLVRGADEAVARLAPRGGTA